MLVGGSQLPAAYWGLVLRETPSSKYSSINGSKIVKKYKLDPFLNVSKVKLDLINEKFLNVEIIAIT